MQYNNKDIYEGNWKEDQKEGEGEYLYYNSNEKYKGLWKNDLREGKEY